MTNILFHALLPIPWLLIVIAHLGNKPFFAFPVQLNEAYLFIFGGSITFILSLLPLKKNIKVSLIASFSLMIIFAANHLIRFPTLGTLFFSTYIFFTSGVLKERWLSVYRSDVSVQYLIFSLVNALILLLANLFGTLRANPMIFVAMNLAISSSIYLSLLRLKIHTKMTYILPSLCSTAIVILAFYPHEQVYHIFTNSMFTLACCLVIFSVFKQVPKKSKIVAKAFSKPEIVVVSYFMGLAAIGGMLLQIPGAQIKHHVHHSIIDSFFTAMSAACVTGLTTLDTALDFSLWGQATILLLIQLGGFGIISLSAWTLFILQRGRLSLHHEHTLYQLSSYHHQYSVQGTLRIILGYVIAVELFGTSLLFYAFSRENMSLVQAFWQALFTAISAFCNAGFALHSNSLLSYQHNSLVLLTVSFLIIAGGFAPLMALNLPKGLVQKKLTLNEKLALASTAIFLLSGFVFFLTIEWSHSLQNLNFWDKMLNAWFLSSTTRTAGFFSINLSEMRDVTGFFMMILMFIGGNPGGTAGGIKTITTAVVLIAGISAISGRGDARIFNRRIPSHVIYRSMAIVCFGLISGFFIFLMLALTQDVSTIPLLFESVSALGTVGLSLGATEQLDEIGKIIVAFAMLVGRVGPITFALLILRGRKEEKWKVPKEEVFVT